MNTETHLTSKHTRHLFTQSVYKSLYCLVNVIFTVSDPNVFPFLPFFLFLIYISLHQTPSEVLIRVNQSQKPPVLCSCSIVFLFPSLADFTRSLVVWCWYRWWCCACVDESHGFLISCHLLGQTQSIMCSLPSSSTHHGPPAVEPLTSLSNPVVIIICHTSIKDPHT